MELAPLDPKDYCPRRVSLGSLEKRKARGQQKRPGRPKRYVSDVRLGNALRGRYEIFPHVA